MRQNLRFWEPQDQEPGRHSSGPKVVLVARTITDVLTEFTDGLLG